MKNFRVVLGFILSALLVLLVVAGAVSCKRVEVTPTPTEVIKWRFQTAFTPKFPISEQYVQLVDEIKEKTGGRLEIEIFWSNTLGFKGTEMLTVMSDGLIEIAEVAGSFGVAEEPWLGWSELPAFFKTKEEYFEVSKALAPMTAELWEKYNSKLMATCTFPTGFYLNLYGKKPYNSLGLVDFKGAKIRQYSHLHVDFFNSLGAASSFIPIPETYMALQTGVVDGYIGGSAALTKLKLWEVVNYDTYLWPAVPTVYIVISGKAWNALPADIQAMLPGIFKEWNARSNQLALDPTITAEFEELAKENGVTIVDDPGFRAELVKLGPACWEEWGKTNADCKRVLDIMRKTTGR